jgi:hypothetical protein
MNFLLAVDERTVAGKLAAKSKEIFTSRLRRTSGAAGFSNSSERL